VSEWQECKLGKLVSLEYGKSLSNYHGASGKYPVYGTNGKIGETDTFLCEIPSVIIGRKGAYRGVHFSKIPFYTIDTAFYIKPKNENIDLLFLYNFLLTQDINSKDSGSAIPSTDRNEIYDVDILLPPLREQRAIAAVLSGLDDKIDLLNRQNKTLEALAATLWRKMFFEDANSNWKKGELGDFIASIETGRRPKGGIDHNLDVGIPSIGAENINGIGNYEYGKTKYITEEYFNQMNTGIIQNYDILVYKDGAYIGKKSMFANGFPYKKCCINEHVFLLRTGKVNNQLFLYFVLEQEELEQLNANSAQPGLNQAAMKSFEIVIPHEDAITDFGSKARPFIDKIFANGIQIRTLSSLRDSLLPKLMSGEVRVTK
jgi:type I restriction enzyme, S subunit